MTTTPEQEARDMLERMGVEDAQSWSAGEVVELANVVSSGRKLIETHKAVTHENALLRIDRGILRSACERLLEVMDHPGGGPVLARLTSAVQGIRVALKTVGK